MSHDNVSSTHLYATTSPNKIPANNTFEMLCDLSKGQCIWNFSNSSKHSNLTEESNDNFVVPPLEGPLFQHTSDNTEPPKYFRAEPAEAAAAPAVGGIMVIFITNAIMRSAVSSCVTSQHWLLPRTGERKRGM